MFTSYFTTIFFFPSTLVDAISLQIKSVTDHRDFFLFREAASEKVRIQTTLNPAATVSSPPHSEQLIVEAPPTRGPGQHSFPDPHTNITVKRHLRPCKSLVPIKKNTRPCRNRQLFPWVASTALPLFTGETLAYNGLSTVCIPKKMHRSSHPVTLTNFLHPCSLTVNLTKFKQCNGINAFVFPHQ